MLARKAENVNIVRNPGVCGWGVHCQYIPNTILCLILFQIQIHIISRSKCNNLDTFPQMEMLSKPKLVTYSKYGWQWHQENDFNQYQDDLKFHPVSSLDLADLELLHLNSTSVYRTEKRGRNPWADAGMQFCTRENFMSRYKSKVSTVCSENWNEIVE